MVLLNWRWSASRWFLAALVVLLLALIVWTGWAFWYRSESELPPAVILGGDQEIAWLMPATSLPAWNRFVEAAAQLCRDSNFDVVWACAPERSHGHLDMPELAFRWRGDRHRLWIRWYKLTSEYSAQHWLRGLMMRRPRPLAVIGGNTSDRAAELIRALSEWQHGPGQPPVLLLTTATADEMELSPGAGLTDLLEGYPGRAFRFSFTNRQMAEALVDFVTRRPAWLPKHRTWDAITWRDDPYSEDFANRISDALRERDVGWLRKSVVPYGVGSALLPSVRERQVIEEDLVATWAQESAGAHVLVLPTTERIARRVLVGLHQAAPWTSERLTVVLGDSVNFNVLCRDRRLLWPVELVPMRILTLAHEDPVGWTGQSPRRVAELAQAVLEGVSLLQGMVPHGSGHLGLPVGRHTATDDLALWTRLLRAVAHAAWSTEPADASNAPRQARLVAEPQTFLERLRTFHDELGVPFFDPRGNRRRGMGEYVVCLEPWRQVNRLTTWSVLEVWHSQSGADGLRRWQLRCRWLLSSEE
ncbi:MAG: hypothetical protein RMI91_12885 [Gemmatales bacterium]|nr:hypothetical protein [Gemmatales bacterium]MDW7995538.1 hypothetical protein [Gemmatales bacterium]